ncbi:MAG: hypothetical protein MK210_18630, partial [Dehalococcoidia bacterium]|nr:hypothetical protein [Dehalococcoidia bacterium]
PAHQSFHWDPVTQFDDKAIKIFQLLIYYIHLEANVVESSTFFLDVHRDTARRPDSLQKLQIGVADRHEAPTYTDVFPDDDWAWLQTEDTLIEIDARIQVANGDPDVMHQVGWSWWLSGNSHVSTSCLKDFCSVSVT